jgi:hypothetical protein
MPEEGHVRFGQAKPSVSNRFGAPRRLFTSCQGRTGEGAGPTTNLREEERRQAGQSCGERGGAGGGGAGCAWLLPTGQGHDGASKENKAARERT